MDPLEHPDAIAMKQVLVAHASNSGVRADNAALNLFIRSLMKVCGRSPFYTLLGWLSKAKNPQSELETVQAKMLLVWISGGRFRGGWKDGAEATQ